MAAAAAVIIAAIVAAGASVTAAALNNSATDKANTEAKKLAMLNRQDQFKLHEDQQNLSKAQLRLQKKGLLYQRDADLFGRKERALERGYTMRQNDFNKQLDLINRNDNMRAHLASIWKGGK